MELEATVIKVADADKQRVETQASAERQRLTLEAEGRAAASKAQAQSEADAARVRGAAEAEAARLRGIAEADVIRAKGEAEAEAMRVKAAAYHEYNSAAVLDKVITNLPEVVRALAEPLSKVDRISIVSTGSGGADGNGSSLGMSRLTGNLVAVLAQVPAILETLTGVKMSDLMERVPGLSTVDGTVTPENASPNGNGTRPAETATPSATTAAATSPLNATRDEPATPTDTTPAPESIPVATPSAAPGSDGISTTPARHPASGPRRQRNR